MDLNFIYLLEMVATLWTQNVKWTYIKPSEDVHDVFLTSYVRVICILCIWEKNKKALCFPYTLKVFSIKFQTLHEKWSILLRIFSINVTKSEGNLSFQYRRGAWNKIPLFSSICEMSYKVLFFQYFLLFCCILLIPLISNGKLLFLINTARKETIFLKIYIYIYIDIYLVFMCEGKTKSSEYYLLCCSLLVELCH